MPDSIKFFLSLNGIFSLITAALVVFLILKRIKDKKNENFEDRDN